MGRITRYLYLLGLVAVIATAGYLVLAYAVYAGELGGIIAVASLLLGAAVVLGLIVGMVVLHHVELMLGDPVFAPDDD